jgi:hypothetical protein
LWNFHTNPYYPSEQRVEPQVTVPVNTSTNDKLRVAGHGPGNTRARRTNTAKRAPNMLMHHGHVPVPVCTISILWNFHTNPYHPSEQRVETPSYGAGEHLKNHKLRVAWQRAGQHARLPHKHCKACANHAHAP